MLWVLKRTVSLRWFFRVTTTYVLVEKQENQFLIMQLYISKPGKCLHMKRKRLKRGQIFYESSQQNETGCEGDLRRIGFGHQTAIYEAYNVKVEDILSVQHVKQCMYYLNN